MRWWLVVLLAAAVAGKGKKHKHQKPGRAVLDRLSSTTLTEFTVTSEAGSGLLPAPLDVAPYSTVHANATCGEQGPEEFCRDTPGKRGIVCDVCEGSEGSPSRRHPAALAIDGDPATWWQSPTLGDDQYRHVELIAILPDKMELLHVIIKSGPSPRPLAWSLEVSSTESGEDWRLIRAFGDKEHCKILWDLRPERRRRKARGTKRTSRADKPTCSTQFASPKPLENGEMHVGVGEGVPARRVRISFRATHSPATHQYYTVRELTLAARCLCHGHAKHCTVNHKGAKCECLQGTCGVHCQRCCGGGPWRPHEPCDSDVTDSDKYSCGERGESSLDDSGAILCVNCTENRAGPLCDRCLIGFYNAHPDGPCLPCDCDPEGSDGSCKWDRKQHRVSCHCLPNYKGHLCDSCEDPNAVFPNCVVPATTPACKCDPRGIVDPERVCDDVCECKANVVGERCDTCAMGYFGLSAELSVGCRPCYCSHVATHCDADLTAGHDTVLPLGEAWLVSDADGLETTQPSVDGEGKPFVVTYEVEGWESYYWVTSAVSGDATAMYGGGLVVRTHWAVARGDSGGSPTLGPDVILLAQDGTKLTSANSSHESPGLLEIRVPLLEGGWYLDAEPVARSQLMDVLSNLKALMIRANFHNDQDEVRLESVEIRGSAAGVREICRCPAGYTGAQCGACAWTHVRTQRGPSTVPAFECVPCACNMHAGCSTVDGPCEPCQHNTTGPHCERCLPGHYGNPVQGACKPCACPLYEASNNFSPNCALAAAAGDEYVCTQCPDGYTGDHCELCDSGYWGSPATLGGSCQPCACGGGPCRADTGKCLLCPPHTEGERCDQCQEGYWAGGVGGECVSCACGAGALPGACEARGGQCACAAGWAGRACDICATGHGGVEAGCPACHCGIAAMDNECEASSGACRCAPGAAPPLCNTCLDGHYALSDAGCKGCNCSVAGAESNVCDIRTGQCRCKPHVTGRACDTCAEGYWGLQLGGCRRCECGAGAAACDPESGLCACAPGVGGAKCDRCLPAFYGFSATGCLPCPTCTEGKVCSPVNGRCVCPARTRGPGCAHCAKGYWDRAAGCRPCNCGPAAVSDTCDPVSGACKCRTGWAGAACERCAEGHFGPRCKPCHCNRAGTKCTGRVCPCDDQGRCPCKDNVVGDKCSTCLEGTFGLSAENPVGCTACFCFGRSARCTQADVARAALHAPAPRHLTLLRAQGHLSVDQNSLLAVHTHSADATIAVPWPPVPVYIELSDLFLGDRLLSYGGALRFKVEEEGGEPLPPELLNRFPLVRLYGPNGIVLDYFERVDAVNGSHGVYLHESLWEVRGRGGVASRGLLMHVLQDLRRVQLRVSTRAPANDEPLHVLVLHVSLETAVAGLARGAPAPGIERCACPREYAAASCQRAAAGYWLPPAAPRLHRAGGLILIQLAAAAARCRCHDRADTCHTDTGHCLNCRNNTGGVACERCADGYFGSPDTPDGCQPCPCPSPSRSNALSCSLIGTRMHCNCLPGYAGEACEQCDAGYRRAANGSCVACGCDVRGAASPRCDVHGTCHCRPHAAGDLCDRCSTPRHYLDHDGCKPCDNCTQTLLDAVESLNSDLRTRADLTELSRIPQPFPALREFSQNTSNLHAELQHAKKDLEQSRSLENALERLEATEHQLFTEANMLKTQAAKWEGQAQYLSLESMSALEEVLKQKRNIGEKVAELDDFAQGERHLSAHRALKEARHLLKTIKEVSLVDYVVGATDVSDSANLQSTSVHEYKYRIEDIYKRVQQLQARLDEWEDKSSDLSRLADVVWSASDTVGDVAKRVTPRLIAVRDAGLKCQLILEDLSNLSARNLTDTAADALLQARSLVLAFPGYLQDLRNLTLAAEEKEGILYSLTPTYKQKYLDAVEKHVALLSQKAKEYKSAFAGTRAAAAAGVAAARAWSDVALAVGGARDAAEAAAAAAATAAKLARGPQPLLHTADVESRASEELKRRGAHVLAKADELRRQLEAAERGTDVVSVALRALGWRERALAAGAGEGTGTADAGSSAVGALKGASAQADRVFAAARALYDEAAELRRRVRYQLRRRLAALQRLGDTALGAAEEHVSQIRGNTVRGAEVAAALGAAAAARAREHSAAASALTPALRSLRDRLRRAHHAAATISISIASPSENESKGGAANGCARAFAVWSAPSVTRYALTVTFDAAVRDGTLLYIHDPETERYMRLAVKDSKLRLTWDVGGGEGVVVHPEVLQPTLDDADQTTYKIEVERVWGLCRLRVERSGQEAGAAAEAVEASNATRGGALGGSGAAGGAGGAAWWAGETRAPLPATLHALLADGAAVGLWAFAAQPADATCVPRTHRWVSASRGEQGQGLAWFSGAGYVELRRGALRPPDRRRFSLSLTVRTRDAHALLFLAQDTHNNRSVSVWMVDCRVVFRVAYGGGGGEGGSRLEIAARAPACDGRPLHIQASRLFNGLERGSLRVNGEETLGSPSPPVQAAAELPELGDAPYWVGGAPPGAVEAPALLGCLGALTVDRQGYNLLDTAARYGVEVGCAARVLRSAIFEGEGYMELGSAAFRRKSALGLSFRSRSSSGLLLYRAPSLLPDNEVDDEDDGDDKHFLVLALVDGELVVMASAGKNELHLKLNGTKLDDGRLHTVKLVRAHKQLEVWCDEKQLGSGPLPGGAIPARSRGLFLGGAPRGPPATPTSPAVPNLPAGDFAGTIMDLIIDSSVVGLESGRVWGAVRVGRAEAAQAPAVPRALHAQADASAATQCSKSWSYTVEAGAVRFGDGAGSHAALRVRPPRPHRHDFSLQLQLRTFATQGLVFLLPGPRTKPKHFIALFIKEGKLKLVVRGRTRRDLSLPTDISDGTWRTVSVRVSKSRAVLSSGGAAATARAPPLARASRLYVGGLPLAPPPHVPSAVARLGGLVGCVRRVTVCGRAEDLVRDARAHHAVGQCFPSVERGAYFAGDAHAVWSSKWWSEDEESIEIKLQFRSTAPSGVIFSAGGLVLELKDGMLVLSWGGARAEAAARCGAWHAAAARAGRWALSLALDAAAAPPALLPQPAPFAPGLAPLLIGAAPEGNNEEGRENFKGCIRDVVVGGQKRGWPEMEALHNVLLDSCPTP